MNLKQLEAFVTVAESGKRSVPDTADDQCTYFIAGERIKRKIIRKKYKRSKSV